MIMNNELYDKIIKNISTSIKNSLNESEIQEDDYELRFQEYVNRKVEFFRTIAINKNRNKMSYLIDAAIEEYGYSRKEAEEVIREKLDRELEYDIEEYYNDLLSDKDQIIKTFKIHDNNSNSYVTAQTMTDDEFNKAIRDFLEE